METFAFANIKKVELKTEETTPKTIVWETAEEADYVPDVSEGAEAILRVRNRIIATNNTEDIQYGATLTFKDNVFPLDMLPYLDGGTIAEGSDGLKTYDSIPLGTTVKKLKYTVNIYTEEKDSDGETIGYLKFIFKNCKAKPMKLKIKNGEFIAPEFVIVSRAKKNTPPFQIVELDAIP